MRLSWGASASPRIVAFDLARAAALIGMFAAHVAASGDRYPFGSQTRGWVWIAEGRSSALFAVLAGVAVTLIARGDKAGLWHAAARIWVRGALLIGLGYALVKLDTPIAIVLMSLGLMMALSTALLRAPTVALAGASAVFLVGGALLYWHVEGALDGIWVLESLTAFYYPAMSWLGYVTAGMLVGRLDVRKPRTAGLLVATGLGLIVAGYGSGRAFGAALPWRMEEGPEWASIHEHAYTVFELVGNTGVALLIIGVCALIARPLPLLRPALAFGSMSLTVYTAHLLAIWWEGDEVVWEPSNAFFVALTLGLMTFAFLWNRWLGRGPLERLVTWASGAGADALLKAVRALNRHRT